MESEDAENKCSGFLANQRKTTTEDTDSQMMQSIIQLVDINTVFSSGFPRLYLA